MQAILNKKALAHIFFHIQEPKGPEGIISLRTRSWKPTVLSMYSNTIGLTWAIIPFNFRQLLPTLTSIDEKAAPEQAAGRMLETNQPQRLVREPSEMSPIRSATKRQKGKKQRAGDKSKAIPREVQKINRYICEVLKTQQYDTSPEHQQTVYGR